MFSFQTQPAEVDKCLRTQSTTFTYIHLHPHLPMSLTPTFILPYSTLQGCSGAPGPRPAYKHSLSAPIHAHVVPVQYGDTYGVTQGHPGPTDPRTSQCQPKTQHIHYFCLSQRYSLPSTRFLWSLFLSAHISESLVLSTIPNTISVLTAPVPARNMCAISLPYILKAKKFAESAFQSQKICGKSA